MNKNMQFKYKHDNLGDLTVNIYGNSSLNTTDAINPKFLVGTEKKSAQEFLEMLYIAHIKNEEIVEIIGDMMVTQPKLSNKQIVEAINKRYNANKKTNNSSNEESFNVGDGIFVEITPVSKPMDRYFTANVRIKNSKNHGLVAYIDDNYTREDCRRQGLQTMAFKQLEKYLSSHKIGAIVLEAQDLDGNEFNLEDAYKKLGFDKVGSSNRFIKDIGRDNEMYM